MFTVFSHPNRKEGGIIAAEGLTSIGTGHARGGEKDNCRQLYRKKKWGRGKKERR